MVGSVVWKFRCIGANFESCVFLLIILLTADAVEFTIAPVVRGIQFSGVFDNRGGG